MVELKPCPFCGGKAQIWEERVGNRTIFHVSCENENCGVIVETRDSFGATRESAAAAWERRA